MLGGRFSPAEKHTRRDLVTSPPGHERVKTAKVVGTEHKIVGRWRTRRSKMEIGSGAPGCWITVAPAARPVARNFLPDLKPKQICNFTNSTTGVQGVNLLIGSVGGPDAQYQPLGLPDVNPWRYNSSSPTNNPGSYDLWIQLAFGGKTNLICNWSKQVQINSPLP